MRTRALGLFISASLLLFAGIAFLGQRHLPAKRPHPAYLDAVGRHAGAQRHIEQVYDACNTTRINQSHK